MAPSQSCRVWSRPASAWSTRSKAIPSAVDTTPPVEYGVDPIGQAGAMRATGLSTTTPVSVNPPPQEEPE